jgi:hypothetical protein
LRNPGPLLSGGRTDIVNVEVRMLGQRARQVSHVYIRSSACQDVDRDGRKTAVAVVTRT